MIIAPKHKVGFVVHDAGAATLIMNYLDFEKIYSKALIVGPAKKVIPDSLNYSPCHSLDEVIDGIDVLITGTSLPAIYELAALQIAKEKGIQTISFLDSWLNYRVRFEGPLGLIIPDLLVVTDDYAFQLATEQLPEFNIVQNVNYYKKFILARYGEGKCENSNQNGNGILYVTEPTLKFAKDIYGDEKYWGYDEFDCLDFFLKNRGLIAQKTTRLIIKPHPSEHSEKYDRYRKYGEIVDCNNSEGLISLMQKVDTVVGCSTMALVVATWLDKAVFSSMPPGGRGFYLPKENINFLSDIVSKHEK